MKRGILKVVAFTLCVTILTGILPLGIVRDSILLMGARAESSGQRQDYSEILDQAAELIGQEAESTSGDWRYVRLQKESWAVITGYDGTVQEEISVPAVLDGLDVVGLTDGVFGTMKGIRQVNLPVNVLAMGKNALPAGATVRANSGVYAQTWARKNGHAFSNASSMDFVTGVVDLSGIAEENFVRISAEEVWLRSLEARQIAVGTLFFLPDPGNLYQISYYQATDMSETTGDFVIVRCSTPDVNAVFHHVTGTNEIMKVDYSTLKLAEGVTLAGAGQKRASGSSTFELPLKIKTQIDLGKVNLGNTSNKVKLAIDGGVTLSYKLSYDIGIFTTDIVKIEETQKQSFSVSVGTGIKDTEAEEDFKEKMEKARRLMQHRGDRESVKSDYNIGSAVVFSIYGIVNVNVSVRFSWELNGELKVTFSTKNKTTYSYREGQAIQSSSQRDQSSIEGSADAKLKIGFTLSLEIYVAVVRIAYVSLFAGIEMEAKFEADLGDLFQALANVDIVHNEPFELDRYLNLNMLDTIHLSFDFVVEVKIGLGDDKIATLDLAKIELLRYHFLEAHLHLLQHYTFTVETVEKDGTTRYVYTPSTEGKHFFHLAEECPYTTKEANFYWAEDGSLLQSIQNIEPGSEVHAPDLAMFQYLGGDNGQKLNAWYTDSNCDADSIVQEWPYTVADDTDFYAATSPYHRAVLIDAHKKILSYAGTEEDVHATVHDSFTGEDHDLEANGGLVAEDEKLKLPEKLPDGTDVLYWFRATSPTNLVPVTEDQLTPGTNYQVSGDPDQEITLCAVTGRDIRANFYVDGRLHDTLYTQMGGTIILPEEPEKTGRWIFEGWRSANGETEETILEPGTEIVTDENTPHTLTYVAKQSYDGSSSTLDPDLLRIGARIPATGTPVSDETMFNTTEKDGKITVTGLKSEYIGSVYHLEIPSTIGGKPVTAVAANAFNGNQSLLSLILPSSVTTVGSGMVSGCTALLLVDLSTTQITEIPNSFASGDTGLICVLLPQRQLDRIGTSAFSGCRSIGAVKISAPIEDYAFYNCTYLSSVTLGSAVTAIGDYAFKGCTRLAAFTIPDCVETIGKYIISGCTRLTTLTVNAPSELSSDRLMENGTNSVSSLIIGEKVETLGSYCFANYTSLASITLPSTLKKVGSYCFSGSSIEELTISMASATNLNDAFRGMNSLKTLNVTAGVVGYRSFSELTSLETVNIGAEVIRINSYAFQDCTNLHTVQFEEGILEIGSYAFRDCTALTEISFPDSLISIGEGCISGCIGITGLSIGAALNSVSDRANAFYIGDGSALKTIEIREGAYGIPAYAFMNQWASSSNLDFSNLRFTRLSSVTVAASVRTIGRYAFAGIGLHALTINGQTKIEENAFRNCSQLEEIIFSGGTIAEYAFSGSTSIRRVEIQSGTVGPYAFRYCSGLEEMKLGDGVKSIGTYAFADCTGLTTVDLGQGIRSVGSYAFSNCTSLKTLSFPDSVTSYGNYMLEGCTALETLVIGGGQKTLTRYAFSIGDESALNAVTIRKGVSEIGDYFLSSSPVKTVDLPDSLTTISGSAFNNSGLKRLVFQSDIDITSTQYNYKEGCRKPALQYVYIPGGTIGGYAFYDCTALTTVELGEGVSAIGTSAFENCSSLQTMYVPNSVETIESFAFSGCSAMRELSLGMAMNTMYGNNLGENNQLKKLTVREGATSIPQSAFTGSLPNLETLSIASSVTSIGQSVFENSGVKEITISSEPNIGSYAFSGCKRLESISLRGGDIGYGAFLDCVNLKKAEIAAGSIGASAFRGCTSLSNIRLGDGVTGINENAFRNCKSLTRLIIPDSVTTYGTNMIFGCTGLKYLSIGGGAPVLRGDSYGAYPFAIGPEAALERIDIAEGVEEISGDFFRNRYNSTYYGYPMLSTIHFPRSLKNLSAVLSGTALQKLVLRGTTSIGSNVCKNMTTLESVEIAGGWIGSYAFSGCTALKSVVLGDQLTGIGECAFENCSGLTSLRIPDSVTSLGSNLIIGCAGLEYLYIGSGLKTIGTGRFNIGAGSALQTLVVGEGVNVISENALGNQNGEEPGFQHLVTVTLPSTLNTLGKGNLSAWPNLQHLYLKYACRLTDTAVSPNLTIYTDYYNAYIDDFTLEHQIRYVILEEEELPKYTLYLAGPVSGLKADAYTLRTDLEVTRGMNGERIPMPEGMAVFSEQQLSITDTITIDPPQLQGEAIFRGWYLDPDYTVRWDGSTMTAVDLTLYARVDAGIKVHFAINVSDFDADPSLPDEFSLYTTVRGSSGDSLDMPALPSVNGMCFIGWYLDETFSQPCQLEVVPETDTVIYGQMVPVTAGAVYQQTEGGLQLVEYTLQQDESPYVILPENVNGAPVVSIAAGAFSGSDVRKVTIPASVTHIAEGAFAGSQVKYIQVNQRNQHYTTSNDVLYTKDGTVLVAYPPKKTGSSFSIPEGVTRIAEKAFKGQIALTSVYFPSGLTEIGASAFSGCTGLKVVQLPDSVTTIRKLAFEGCSNLYSFTARGLTVLESSGTVNGRTVYYETLPTTNIRVYGQVGSGVLRDYYSIQFEDGFYPLNYNLYTLTLNMNGRTDTLNCEAGMPLPGTISEMTQADDGTMIRGWYRNSSDTLWDFENDVMPAGDMTLYALYTELFEYTSKTVSDSSGESWYGNVLTGWNGSGNEITVPGSYQGRTVYGLDADFFTSAGSAGRIIIPSTVVWIEEGASFGGTVVADTDSAAGLWAQENDIDLEPIEYTLTLDANLGEAVEPQYAAKGTPILLPTPERAGWTFRFWGASNASSSSIPLTEEGLYIMPGGNTTLYAIWEGTNENVPFTWTGANRTITITGYTGSGADVVIPETINNWPVTVIADEAFEGSTIKTIELGPVETIGRDAFRDCESLVRVTMRQVKAIGESAFAGCDMLLTVTLCDSLREIGGSAFSGCTRLSAITIPDQVNQLGDSVFEGCSALRKVTLGAGIETYAANLFNGCGNLAEIQVNGTYFMSMDGILYDQSGTTLLLWPAGRTDSTFTVPEGVTTIGERAFAGTKNLKTVILPTSVTTVGKQAFIRSGITGINLEHVQSIGDSAFFGCAALTEIVLGDGLNSLGGFAFVNCPQLSSVTIAASVPMDEEGTYFDTNTGLIITGTTGSPAEAYALTNGIAFSDPNGIIVSSIEISEPAMTLNRGETCQLNVSTDPEDARVTWSSSDDSIVRVDEDGLVRGLSCGTAMITARADNGLSAVCEVTVTADIQQILLEEEYLVPVGTQKETRIAFVPATPSETEVTWSIQDESVATVDENGVITGIAVGTTRMTVTAQNGISATVPVTVFIPVESLTIVVPDQPITYARGMNTVQLGIRVAPENATYQECTWHSSSEGVKITDEGLVTFNGSYNTTITAISTDPEMIITSITLTPERVLLGDVATVEILTAYVTAAGAEFSFRVTVNGVELIRDTDYTASWDTITGPGDYTLTLNGNTTYGGYTGSMQVPFTVGAPFSVYDSVDLIPGQQGRIPVRIEENAGITKDQLAYSSSDTGIFTVDETGTLNAVAEGTATLTVSAGDMQSVCQVRVKAMNTIKLPGMLKTAEAQAFEGNGTAERIIIPAGTEEIGSRAFANMSALTQVVFEGANLQIAEDAFTGSNPMIVCDAGSEGEAFAKAHQLRYLVK